VRVIFATLSGDPVLDMLIGAVFTVASFSSLAIVLLTATLAATNVVSVQVALCLVLGANLGSGVLAFLVTGALGRQRPPGCARQPRVQGRRLRDLLARRCPGARVDCLALDSDVRRQVLHFHVIFNVTLALGLHRAHRTAWPAFVKQVLPDVDDSAVQPPALPRHRRDLHAGARARQRGREALRIGDTIEQMLNGMLDVIRTNDER
jgi:phosphate:Na+ symporter